MEWPQKQLRNYRIDCRLSNFIANGMKYNHKFHQLLHFFQTFWCNAIFFSEEAKNLTEIRIENDFQSICTIVVFQFNLNWCGYTPLLPSICFRNLKIEFEMKNVLNIVTSEGNNTRTFLQKCEVKVASSVKQ